jgi:hypothetical protein
VFEREPRRARVAVDEGMKEANVEADPRGAHDDRRLFIFGLVSLRDEATELCAHYAWTTTLIVRIHAGDVVCGPFGPRADKRFDIIGREVNLTVRLPTRGFALSAEAFRCLSAAARARFKKHSMPITYIPVEDRRPSPTAKLDA